MFETITAFAETAAPAAADAAQGADAQDGMLGMIISLLPMILIFVLLYWMMIRPQKKQQKAQQAMRAALKVGDKVVTIGGVCGKVAKIKDDCIYIESGMPGAPDDKAYIKFKKSAVESVEGSQEA